MAATWRIRFSTADVAQQFLDLLSTPEFTEAHAWSVGARDTVVTIAAADDVAVLDTWPVELVSDTTAAASEDARIGVTKSRLVDAVRRRLRPLVPRFNRIEARKGSGSASDPCQSVGLSTPSPPDGASKAPSP